MLFSLVLLLLTFAGCLLFAFKPVWFPIPISLDAIAYDRQFAWTLWIAGIIFVAVQLLLAWTLFQGLKRRKAASFSGSRRLEWIWTVATGFLFLGLAVIGSRGWAEGRILPSRKARANQEIIRVDAHQFAWSFHYAGRDGVFGHTSISLINDAAGNPIGLDPADPAGKDDIVAANLRIPAKRNVLLLMTSRDVIHDFFVPELRTKQDIVPGMEIPLELRVETPGSYEIACAALCGLGHSQMRSVLVVMPPEEYDRWKRHH